MHAVSPIMTISSMVSRMTVRMKGMMAARSTIFIPFRMNFIFTGLIQREPENERRIHAEENLGTDPIIIFHEFLFPPGRQLTGQNHTVGKSLR